MKLAYKGYDKAGKAVRGQIEAPDLGEAREALRRQGVFVLELTNAQTRGVDLDKVRLGKGGQMLGGGSRLERVCHMLRQLALLVGTGTPLVDALASIERQQPKGPWRAVLESMRARIEEGKSLSEAMLAHPQYFDAVCRSLVAAGESGGRLDAMLDRLAKLTLQQVRIRKMVGHAMVYPILLMCVAAGVLVTMVTFVLPRFEGLFKSLDTALPPMTRVLMDASAFLRGQWYIVLGAIVLLVGGLFAYVRSEAGRRTIDVAMVRLPQLGRLTRALATARIARVLGTLLEGKVPLLEALALTRHTVANSLYVALIARAEDAVLRGDSLSSAMADTRLMSPSVVEAIRSGERSGQLAPVLNHMAEYLDEDSEAAVKTLTGLIEPLILLVLGLVVGTMTISMLLPLFDLTAAGGAHGGG